MRVKMREIFTCIHFHFQYFFVLALVFFFFLTFSLSNKAKRIIGAGRGVSFGFLSQEVGPQMSSEFLVTEPWGTLTLLGALTLTPIRRL
jgi:hypothetical protein